MANTDTTINAVINPQSNDAPIDIEKTIKALERNNFVVHYFETGADAVAYLQSRIQHKRVAIGDSRTLLELKVHDALSAVNDDITDIQRPLPGESFRDTALRTMGRNVAAPLNSKKNKKSSLNPCAKLEEKCYECGSPDRICNALTIYYKKMRNMQTMEVIIINEDLGF